MSPPIDIVRNCKNLYSKQRESVKTILTVYEARNNYIHVLRQWCMYTYCTNGVLLVFRDKYWP